MDIRTFDCILYLMLITAVVVFISLYFVKAGYGMFNNGKWGKSISNKIGWVLMEAPVFFVLLAFWILSDRKSMPVPSFFILLMLLHYFQRAFVFPCLFRGKGRMPLAIMAMGIVFNLINGMLQGGWIMFLSPADRYTMEWFDTPQFIIGVFLFFTGMAINLHSDYVIRNLRKPGDTKHYLPEKGFYKYVTSANYFGEIVEWIGFAILTWSLAGLVFAVWTFANLVPRANSIHVRYRQEFGEAVGRRKRVFPFIY